MSAYLCAADTFDYVASFANNTHKRRESIYVYLKADMPDVPRLIEDGTLDQHADRVSAHDASALATILRAENLRSLSARYSETAAWGDDAESGGYRFRRVTETDPVKVLKSIHCLRYQSCECEDYDTTLACALLNTIERLAMNALPGYDDAPWGWERSTRRVVA